MSLTLALSLLGGVVIAALLVQAVWSSRRAAVKRADFSDPLPDGGRREPGLDHDASDGPAQTAADAVASIYPDGDGPGSVYDLPGDEGEARPLRRRLSARIDALIDAIAPLRLEQPIAAENAIPHLPASRRAGTKPFLIEALDADSGEWEAPTPGHRYREFQAGVQLANRTGPLNEIEYSEFVQKIERFAEGIGAIGDFPDMLDVAARARELDQFASQYDAQLTVQLRARGAAWSVGYIQQHAVRNGFVPGVVPGRLILAAVEEGAPPVLTLTFDSQAALADDPNQAALRHVTLAFDVPQTEPALEPFKRWQASAQALADSLEADVVDDRGMPVPASAFDAIGADLGQVYDALAARDLAAGSAAARRLFS